MGIYLQYGCGLCAPEGWLNYDASPSLRIRKIPVLGKAISKVPFPDAAKFGDVVKGLPVAEGSVDAIYCSHVLEHLSLSDFRVALRNTFRVLRSGGVFRLVLPDLKALATQYLSNDRPEAATEFVQNMLIGSTDRPRGMTGLLRTWLGNAQHQWMWDYDSLAGELAKAGFTEIRRAALGDNEDPMWKRVETEDRWVGQLGIQCVRP